MATLIDTLAMGALTRTGQWLNRTLVLPLVAFAPTSRCNSQCASCDWWRSDGAGDLSFDEIAELAAGLPALGTRLVLFTGGEPLLRPDTIDLAGLFVASGLRLHLLTSGLHLERKAEGVAACFERVIVSLDATTASLYQQVRGVDGLEAVERGVALLKSLAPSLPVTARATLHRLNFREMPHLIGTAAAMGFDGISFLAADVTSDAFGRHPSSPRADLLLDLQEVEEFSAIVEQTIVRHGERLADGFIAESAEKLRLLPRYFAAAIGAGPWPVRACNAPWVSAAIDADGAVRPCFFHAPVGQLREADLASIVRDQLPAFRRTLDMARDATCQRCVCTLSTNWRQAPWL